MNETTSVSDSSFQINESLISVLECPNITSEELHTLKLAKYWVGGVSVCVVAFIGIVSNFTAVCVLLSTLSNRNNFNQLAALLFLIDSLYLILSVLTTLQIRLDLTSYTLTTIFPKFTYPVWSISLTLSIFLTVGITHERYIAIKYPIIHRQRMISAKHRRLNLLKYMLCVFICTMLFNIPKFFEIETGWRMVEHSLNVNQSKENLSTESSLEPFLKPTDLRRSPYYSIYYINPATLLVTGIIPLGLLTYWNSIIYKKIKSSSRWHEQHSRRSVRRTNGQRQENEFAKVLIGIVITFVCSHSLRVILNFHEAIGTKNTLLCIENGRDGVPFWILMTNELNKLLLVTNSSVNIIIYGCLNSKFRKTLLQKRKRQLASEITADLHQIQMTDRRVSYCPSI